MTEKEFNKLLSEGTLLFGDIADEVNEIAKLFIRRKSSEFRRHIDWQELCVALALHKRKNERTYHSS